MSRTRKNSHIARETESARSKSPREMCPELNGSKPYDRIPQRLLNKEKYCRAEILENSKFPPAVKPLYLEALEKSVMPSIELLEPKHDTFLEEIGLSEEESGKDLQDILQETKIFPEEYRKIIQTLLNNRL